MDQEIIEGAETLCTIIDNEVEFNGLAYIDKAVVMYVAHGAGPCHDAMNDFLSTDLVENYFASEQIRLFYFDCCSDELNDLAKEMDIVQVPTIGVYTYGVEIGRGIGIVSRHRLVGFVARMYDSVVHFEH